MKKIITLFFIMFSLFSFNAYSESFNNLKDRLAYLEKIFSEEESFNQKVKKLEIDIKEKNYTEEELIDAYIFLIDYEFYYYEYKKAREINKKVIELSKKNNNYKIEYYYYNEAIFIEEFESNIDKTLKYYKLAIDYAKKHENNEVLVMSHTYMADIYSYLNEVQPALENYRIAEQYAENSDDIFNINFGILTLYYYFGIYELAITQAENIEEFLNINEDFTLEKGYYYSLLYDAMNASYIKIENYDNALKYLNKQKQIKYKKSEQEKIAFLNSEATVYIKLGELEKAKEIIDKIDEKSKKVELTSILKDNYKLLNYLYYFEIKDYKKAYEYLESMNEMIYEKEKFHLNQIKKRKIDVLYKLGDIKQALKYQKEYNEDFINIRENKEVSLSIFLFENYKEAELVNENLTLEKNKIKKEEELLKNIKKNNDEYNKILLTLFLIISFIILAIIIIILYFKNKKYSNQDDLTRGYNRRYIFEKLKNIINKEDFYLGIIDIDYFKKINDTYGHLIGDEIIIEIHEEIKKVFNEKNEITARIGGEEFMVITKKDKFEKLRKIIENKLFTMHNIKLTVSIGVQTNKRKTIEQIYNEADVLLYEAKSAGRNNVKKEVD